MKIKEKDDATLGILTDITERKQAEERLCLQSVAPETTAIAVVITDCNGCIGWVNLAFTRLTGYESSEIVGQNLSVLKSSKHDEETYKNLWETILAGNVWHGEIISRRKDGSLYTEEQTITPMYNERGEITHFVAIKQDLTERKQIETGLRISQESLHNVVNKSTEAIIIVDKSGIIKFVNQTAEAILGRSGAELLGEMFGLALTAGEKREVDFIHSDGKFCICEMRTVELDWYGDPAFFVSIHDITERKQAEEELKKSKEFLDNIINALDDPVFVKDEQHCWVILNDKACELMGRPREELIGKSDYDLSPKEEADRLWEIDKLVFETEETKINEEEITWHGEIHTISTKKSVFTDSVNGKKFIAGTIRDITERKRTEESLRRAHAEIEQLLCSISSILISVGPDGRITRWNTAAEIIFGLTSADTVGRPFLECKIQWDWSEVEVHISGCRDKDQPTRIDNVRYTRPDGKHGFLNIIVSPIVSDTSEDSGYLFLGTEITKRKALEYQLAQAQKLESIGQLAAGIAHEINTPIQYVGDNISFLEDAFRDLIKLLKKHHNFLKEINGGIITKDKLAEIENAIQEADLEYLVDEIPVAIQQSLEGVVRISNIVLAMKKFSHPGGEEKTAIDINNAIESTITVSRNEWRYVAEMVTDFEPTLPLVPCLPGDFNQVILNIIVNAAHAITDVVEAGSEGKGTITISSRRQGDSVEIRIADTGTGIPEEICAKIFDPFFTTKEVGKGTGQGLAISHSVIVEKHHGSISFETELGKGTTFIIRLPINSQD